MQFLASVHFQNGLLYFAPGAPRQKKKSSNTLFTSQSTRWWKYSGGFHSKCRFIRFYDGHRWERHRLIKTILLTVKGLYWKLTHSSLGPGVFSILFFLPTKIKFILFHHKVLLFFIEPFATVCLEGAYNLLSNSHAWLQKQRPIWEKASSPCSPKLPMGR